LLHAKPRKIAQHAPERGLGTCAAPRSAGQRDFGTANR
jgi:hypothetical protein